MHEALGSILSTEKGNCLVSIFNVPERVHGYRGQGCARHTQSFLGLSSLGWVVPSMPWGIIDDYAEQDSKALGPLQSETVLGRGPRVSSDRC